MNSSGRELPPKLAAIREKLFIQTEYGVEHQDPLAELDEKEVDYLRRKYGIDPDKKLHRTCINCQARQLIKYFDQPNHHGEANKFNVVCDGIQKSFDISKELYDKLINQQDISRERALLILRSTQDPVAWAELMFGFDDNNPDWALRSYQKEQLRCSARRYVLREGRRSGKTFISALKLVHFLFTKLINAGYDSDGNQILKGPNILVITPYQSQLTNLFNEIQNLIERNQFLVEQVTTNSAGTLYVKTPFFKLETKNGGRISGFVSGIGNKTDGSGGGTIRGQSAHYIYLDETDMIPEEVLHSVVLPILATYKDVYLLATSTPIGAKKQFYKWCLEDPYWKEDYLPSTVLPQWEDIKHEILSETTADIFKQEYLALFLDGTHGVFKPSYVYRARQDYSYDDCTNPTWWHKFAGVQDTNELIKVIGIDWNKNAGTEFVVVAYHPGQHHWYTVEATNIPASEFSSVAWKEEVVRLNYKWKPNYIYADEGYGHTIIEDLKLLGYETRGKKNKDRRDIETAKLPDRLVSFQFASKVELTSPIDGQKFYKTGKEYLVENAVRIFEDGRIWFPEEDDTLRKQLLNYVVQKVNKSTGRPIYGPESPTIADHRLDAFMLALAGLSLEFSVYSGKNMTPSELTFLPKEKLDRRSSKEGVSALEMLHNAAGNADSRGIRPFKMNQDTFLEVLDKTRQDKHRITRRNSEQKDSILAKLYRDSYGSVSQTHSSQSSDSSISRPHLVKRRSLSRRRSKFIRRK